MTRSDIIRATLARLWDTDANAYDMAWAILKAVDLDDDDLEMEVESVISRALVAREFADLGKVAEAVAKVLPGEEARAGRLPLCEGICGEIEARTPSGHPLIPDYENDADDAVNIIRKHFAALSVEEVAETIRVSLMSDNTRLGTMHLPEAQAVMRLLRKE